VRINILIAGILSLLSHFSFAQASDEKARNAVKNIGGAEAMLAAIAFTMSKRLPYRLDGITQLTEVSASGRTYTQYYDLISDDLTPVENIRRQQHSIRKDTVIQLCAASTPKVLIVDYKATYRYVYRHFGKVLFTFDVVAKDC
jgi:hypothetical protein